MTSEKHKSQINILLQDKANVTKSYIDLREGVTLMNSKLEGMTKLVCMLNYGYEILDEILGVAKISWDNRGASFDYNSMNEQENKFVPPKKKF